MTETEIKQLHKKYSTSEKHFELVWQHCQIVRDIALGCVEKNKLDVNKSVLEQACLLHDIGSYPFVNENGEANFEFYHMHALLSETIAREEGASKDVAQLIRTHIRLGLTAQEIEKHQWHLPYKNFEPTSLEGKLLGFADRFHSKRPQFNDPTKYLKKLEDHSPVQAKKFRTLIDEFGLPDLEALSKKYGHPIR